MKRFIMALDSGTTSVRCVIFGSDGIPVSSVSRGVNLLYPKPGYVEQDAGEIWTKQISAAYEAMTRAGCTAAEIAAIGITNQRETAVIWDRKTGEPLCPAIVWQCRRTAQRCAELSASDNAGIIRQKTGLVTDPYFSASKVEWMLQNISGLRERARRGEVVFGTVDSWLIYKLSGGKACYTDISNASRTMLCDIRRGEWDSELCGLFGIPRDMLCEIKPSSGFFCDTDKELLGGSIPVTGVAGDQQAALFGHGCTHPGELKNTYGTGGFLLMNTGKAPMYDGDGGLITTAAWNIGEGTEYALEGSVFVCGAAVQWLRDGLEIISCAADTEALAASVPDCGGVTVIPAFTGLGAPYWDADARGAILGVTRGVTRAHICRATLEAMAFQTVDVVREMERVTGRKITALRADGGATANGLLMQLQADLLGVPVVRPRYAEITARGAAALAAYGAGVVSSHSEMTGDTECDIYTPQPEKEERELRYLSWQDAVARIRTNG